MQKYYIILIILFTTSIVAISQHNYDGQSVIYSNNGNVGIQTTNPDSKLSIYVPGGTASYPSSTSKGDVIQTMRSSNNTMEFGVTKGFNARKSWILSRHSDATTYGNYYATLHLQPDVGSKSFYQGVAIGFDASSNLELGAHLAVDGNVGIGTLNPQANLHLSKNDNNASYPSVTSRGDIFQLYESGNNVFEVGLAGGSNTRRAWILSRHSDISGTYGQFYSTLHIQPDIGDKSQYRGVAIGYNGNVALATGTHLAVDGRVGIGTSNPDSELTVDGTIHAEEVRVDLNVPGPDYVFEEDYNLITLDEVGSYIKENKHLPEIPSALEMEEKGIDLSKMNMLLLKKVEELTLYTLEQEEKIKTLMEEKETSELDIQQQLASLMAEIQQLKKERVK